jgi:hypothetical protein
MIKCVFSTNNEIEALQVKDLLENNGITTLIKNLHTQNILGATKMFTGIDLLAGCIEIYVSEYDVDFAIELLKENINITNNKSDEFVENDINDISEIKSEENIIKYDKSILGKSFILSIISFSFSPLFFNIGYLIKLWKYERNIAIIYTIITVISTSFGVFALFIKINGIEYYYLFLGLLLLPVLCTIKSISIYIKTKSLISIIYLLFAIILVVFIGNFNKLFN